MRFVILLERESWDNNYGADLVTERAVAGPFRTRQRADTQASVIKREADKWEDPEGVTGDENAIRIRVLPIETGGRASARRMLALLYGSET